MSVATVQELLHDASREVRSIMWDVTTLDGPALAAGWPAFARACARASLYWLLCEMDKAARYCSMAWS